MAVYPSLSEAPRSVVRSMKSFFENENAPPSYPIQQRKPVQVPILWPQNIVVPYLNELRLTPNELLIHCWLNSKNLLYQQPSISALPV